MHDGPQQRKTATEWHEALLFGNWDVLSILRDMAALERRLAAAEASRDYWYREVLKLTEQPPGT